MKPLVLLVCSGAVLAQDPGEGFRQLWNKELLDKRPGAKNPKESLNRKAVYKPVSKPGPVPVKSDPKPPSTTSSTPKPALAANDTLLGVTLWRLRRSAATDNPNTRLLVLPPGGGDEVEYTPERISGETPVADGDRVRLTIEVPRTGYLYVIDREVYADGSISPPYLIYPNRLTKPGDNLVAAGRVLEIPDSRDKPNHFEVRRGKANQTAEQFSILVTPEPLAEKYRAGKGPLPIDEAEYKKWESQYFVESEIWELDGGTGKSWTEQEKGANGGSKLSQDDPLPQTLYKVNCEPGKAMLVKVPVKMRR
ncbi:MAG: DUF4384 domain-containing protein [Bryobacteraceae bacterium]